MPSRPDALTDGLLLNAEPSPFSGRATAGTLLETSSDRQIIANP